MPKFNFRSMDRRGQVSEGSANAANLAALTELLRQQGQLLITATAQAEKPAPKPAAPARGGPQPTRMGRATRVKAREMIVFNRQLELLLKAAVPLLEALSTLANQQSNPTFRKVLNDIVEQIRGGSNLTNAFSRHPDTFDQVYLSLLEAGEASGSLPHMISRISAHLDFKASIRARVISAMMYPAVVMGTAMSVVLALLIFVLPVFAELFADFEADLPIATRLLLAASDSLRSRWPIWLGGAAALAASLRWWARQPANRITIDTAMLNLPLAGPLTRSIVITRTLRTLGELIAAGVPLLKALELAEATAGNVVFARVFQRTREEVSAGNPIWMSLAASDYVPDIVGQLVAAAEKTGKLPAALAFVSEFYQNEIDVTLKNLFTAIEPMFVLFLGLVIGGIAVSMLLPIFKLGGIIQ